MNEIFNEFLLAGDKFISVLYLRQSGFTYSTCRPFTKHREEIQNYIYKNELKWSFFALDAEYFASKDLGIRTISDKILKDRAYEIAINAKYDGNQIGLASILYKFFDNKTGCGKKANAVITKTKMYKLHTQNSKSYWLILLSD